MTRRSRAARPAVTAAVVTLGLLLATVTVACGSGGSGSSSPVGAWSLESITNASGTIAVIGPIAGRPVTSTGITFTPDGKVTGSTGCNTFGGTWSAAGSDLKFSAIGMTTKACADDLPNRIETAFSVAFSKSQTYAVHGDELRLTAADDSTALTFRRAD